VFIFPFFRFGESFAEIQEMLCGKSAAQNISKFKDSFPV
jgi:hypothetical protein